LTSTVTLMPNLSTISGSTCWRTSVWGIYVLWEGQAPCIGLNPADTAILDIRPLLNS